MPHNQEQEKELMVLTSHDTLGNTGLKTGLWLEEFAAPYFVFRDAGVELTLASPKGGQPPLDPKSDLAETFKSKGYLCRARKQQS
jgi:putative intracellular protease/amidase